MKPNDYLKKILAEQIFEDDAPELEDLRQRRNNIEGCLRTHFSKSSPSIRWAGSKAKGTMIRESYDGDMTCYFPHDEKEAGETLKGIYDNTELALTRDFQIERKASVLRVRDKEDWRTDLYIDVVPGRYTDDDDVFLHRTTGDKQLLKTNLQTHIDHIRDSGVADAIRLMKLWKVRNGLNTAKTFVLELLVVRLLAEKKSAGLSMQQEHVWTEFRDNPDDLAVEDPANPHGNDLKPLIDDCRHLLSTVASDTLWQIENNGWEAVFGGIAEDDGNGGGGKSHRSAALQAAVASVATRNRPWRQGT